MSRAVCDCLCKTGTTPSRSSVNPYPLRPPPLPLRPTMTRLPCYLSHRSLRQPHPSVQSLRTQTHTRRMCVSDGVGTPLDREVISSHCTGGVREITEERRFTQT